MILNYIYQLICHFLNSQDVQLVARSMLTSLVRINNVNPGPHRIVSPKSGELLGVPAPPPFADPSTSGTRLLGGVNYASAAAGILDETGRHYVRISTLYMLAFFFTSPNKFNIV